MRVRNKEIRSRRHRKEQVMKAAARTLREQYGDKKAAPSQAKTKGPSPKKTSAPKSAERK